MTRGLVWDEAGRKATAEGTTRTFELVTIAEVWPPPVKSIVPITRDRERSHPFL